jgi:heat-inducible transcriptional repressor
MTMREEALDERSKKILRELISIYCNTGEPVGSRTLSKKGKMELSPATIRNVLSDLETMGYITQPHTSAGRVPTDKGYRFFVNNLLRSQDLNALQKEWIENRIQPSSGDFEKILLLTTELLASLSHHVALAVAPNLDKMILQNIDFIHVNDHRILAVTITKGGLVTNKIIEMEESFNQEELTRISNYIKSEFCGRTLPSIRSQIMHLMKQEQIQYDMMMKKAVLLSKKTLAPSTEPEQLFVIGASQIVNYPEFSNIANARELLEALEEKSKILRLLTECIEGDGTHIFIGSENKDVELKGLTLISSPYKYQEQSVGTLGILGPTRMEYGRVIPLVDHIAKVVSNILTRGD